MDRRPGGASDITAAGIPYAWLRWSSGSIWPVAVMHATFNEAMGRWTTIATAASPAALAYTTTKTGLATHALMIILGAGLFSLAGGPFNSRNCWCLRTVGDDGLLDLGTTGRPDPNSTDESASFVALMSAV